MALYEHIFLARQDVTPQQVEALTEQIKSKIASLGGAVTKVEPWGLKSLAFRIKKNDPKEDGFVFSLQQIKAHAVRHHRLILAKRTERDYREENNLNEITRTAGKAA